MTYGINQSEMLFIKNKHLHSNLRMNPKNWWMVE